MACVLKLCATEDGEPFKFGGASVSEQIAIHEKPVQSLPPELKHI